MNRRSRLFAALLFAVAVATPQRADAMWVFTWLDDLSGPGPFWGLELNLGVHCFPVDPPPPPPKCHCAKPQDEPRSTSSATIDVAPSCRRALLKPGLSRIGVVLGGAVASNNPLDYGEVGHQSRSTAVGLLTFGGSYDYTLAPAIDVGAEAGFAYFIGPRFTNFGRPYIKPAKVTLRPLVLAHCGFVHCKDEEKLKGQDVAEKHRWLLVYLDWHRLIGDMDGGDFGAPADQVFKVQGHEDNFEWGVTIDLLRLARKTH
jgi:hypothetical protein